ncbi:FAD-dependent oxidoreductase [Streptomyces sp. NPDC008092]|uniref:NAD(P)/FAD-dependent oxidoreductase n=1 Tax=Streptomyces sp. NPDC008092 TaxID=3364808 RepID=UPI0036EEECD0
MAAPLSNIVVVGASLAGLHAARALRDEGYDGRLTVIGDEPQLPYDRPPLSKQLLTGAWSADQVSFDIETDALSAEWLTGNAAVALDTRSRRVRLADGHVHPYDGLVIATGAHPRRLSALDMPGVHVVRTLADSMSLAADIAARPSRVAVVGGGFIGAEVAASCRAVGIPVTLIEAAPVLLGRVVGPRMGEVITALHRDHGVDVRLGVSVAAPLGTTRISGLELSDGSVVHADVVVVAIGVTPATGWLAGSGLTIDDGVLCDETCLAAPGIVAAGDIARWPNLLFGETRRVEHWDNAIRQARHAACRLLAGDSEAGRVPYQPVPWFWSDQYDRKLQLVGSTVGHDEVRVVEGDPSDGRFVALYRRDGKVTAALGVNRARSIQRYRGLILSGLRWADAVSDSERYAS